MSDVDPIVNREFTIQRSQTIGKQLFFAFNNVQIPPMDQKFIDFPSFFIHSESRRDFIRPFGITHAIDRLIDRICRVLFIIKRDIYN